MDGGHEQETSVSQHVPDRRHGHGHEGEQVGGEVSQLLHAGIPDRCQGVRAGEDRASSRSNSHRQTTPSAASTAAAIGGLTCGGTGE